MLLNSKEAERRIRYSSFSRCSNGTAVVVVAALINPLKLVSKRVEDIQLVMTVKNIKGCDIEGAVVQCKKYDHSGKQWFSENTNPNSIEEVCMM